MKTRLRHKIVFALLRPFFKVYLFLFFGYKAKHFGIKQQRALNVAPPFFIIGSHVSAYDPFLLSACKSGSIYHVATDDIFSTPFWSKVMKFLVSPIAKSKGASDLQTVRDCLSISKQGGTVAVFPSGNTSYSGKEAYIAPQIARLVKLMDCDVLFFKTRGVFGVNPRWGNSLRKGKCSGGIERVITKDQLKILSVEEVYEIIVSTLSQPPHNQVVLSQYKSNRRAEFLERFLYVCPNCGKFCTLSSNKNILECNNCKAKTEYGLKLELIGLQGKTHLQSLHEWNLFQIEQTKQLLDVAGVVFEDNGEKLLFNMRARLKAMLMKNATLQLYSHKFVVTDKFGNSKTFLFKHISSVAMQGKNKMIIYSKGESFQFKGKKTTNHFKYMVYFYLKKQQQGENNDGILEL